jgi:hypothetical protein
VTFAGGTAERKTTLMANLSIAFLDAEFSVWQARAEQGKYAANDPALIFWLGPVPGDVAPSGRQFQSLPPVPRIDATAAAQPVEQFIHDVIQAALG